MKNKQLKTICTLAWPSIVQEALNTIVTYVDTAMVGALGASASAAVGLTSTVGWLVAGLSISFGIGILAVCAQGVGASDEKKIRIAGQQAFFMTMIVGTILTIVCIGISPYLPTWLGGDVSIREEASLYFMIISLPLLLRTAIFIFSSALRGVSDMKTPMYINLYMNVINIVLNFLLIYPSNHYLGFWIPGASLGVKGAAIATAISFTFGGILISYRYYKNKNFQIYQTGVHFNKNVFQECLRISIPVCMERSVICLGHITFASLVAKLGVVHFAAHTIALQAEQAFYIPGYGFQSAAATLVGNAVGEKNEAKVKQVTYLICKMTFSLMIIAGIILFVFAESLMSFFTPHADVIRLGTSVLRIVSISEPIYGVLVILEGTFNGMGDTKAPFVYSLMTMWGIRILGSWMMIHVFHFDLKAVWLMMVLDNVARCLLLTTRFFQKKWTYRLE